MRSKTEIVPQEFREGKSLMGWSEGGVQEEVEQEGVESTGFFKLQKQCLY